MIKIYFRVPGEQWEDELLERLTTADIVIFLVSPPLLNSDYIDRVEIKGAMERHKKGELVIIPILIRNSDFAESDFRTFQGLPSDLKPVSTWENHISGDGVGLQNIHSQGDVNINISQNSPAQPQNSSNTPTNAIPTLDEVRSLIGSGKTQQAIELLSQYTESNNLDSERDDLILQSGKLSNIEREKRIGTRSSSEIGIEMSRINYALLSMVTDLEKEAGK